MEHVGFVSTDLKKKYKNTQDTWLVHLFFFMLKKDTKTRKIKKGVALCICPFVAEEKYKNTQNTKRVPCAVWASPHAYNKTQKIQKK